jgi:hypothetical protein
MAARPNNQLSNLIFNSWNLSFTTTTRYPANTLLHRRIPHRYYRPQKYQNPPDLSHSIYNTLKRDWKLRDHDPLYTVGISQKGQGRVSKMTESL